MSAADSAPPPHPAAHSSRLAGIGLIALMLGVAVMIAAVFLIAWEVQHGPQVPTPQTVAARSGELARLREQLARDEARLAALEKAVHGEPQENLVARVAKLEAAPDPAAAARLADLEIRLAALEHQDADLPGHVSALQTNQDGLTARVMHLESLDPVVAMKRAAAALAVINLVRANSGGPFEVELKTVEALMPDASELKDLAPIARLGAPTQADLVARFPEVAAAALAAESSARAQGLWARLWANITNVVVVRRIGEAKGTGSEAILARAGQRLSTGDLPGAVAQAETLKGAARASARDWIVQAKARLTIMRANAALADRMTRLLAAP